MAINAIIVLQVLTGLGMLFHGIPKLLDLRGTMKWARKNGFGSVGGVIAAFGESIGALLLILGIFPRIMAGILALLMLGAMMYHWKNREGFKDGWEAAYLYFMACLVIILGGTGWLMV